MLREASIVQDWINEGIEKGMEKGEIKALQGAILDVLEESFGMKDFAQLLEELSEEDVNY